MLATDASNRVRSSRIVDTVDAYSAGGALVGNEHDGEGPSGAGLIRGDGQAKVCVCLGVNQGRDEKTHEKKGGDTESRWHSIIPFSDPVLILLPGETRGR